jgi:phenylacetate-CoA ligase
MVPFHRVPALRGLLHHTHATRKELVEYQNKQLHRLIAHAYEDVPYYRRLFAQHRVKPEDIHTTHDLRLLPITSRQDLQQLPVDEIVVCGVDPERLIARSSSGSTGQPLTVRRTWFEERLHNAFGWRASRSHGLRLTDVHCDVMVVRPAHRRDNQVIHRMVQAMGLGRQVVVSCFQSPEEIVRALHEIRPNIVSGYASVVAKIAQCVNKDELRSLRLRYVGTGGEVLTPLMRAQIEEGFAAPVYQTYGSIEFNLLAWQCIQTEEFHVCDDGMILEVVQGERPVNEGESGEVVGTDLHSFAMPIIRYRLGDVVTKGSESCRCGQPFSAIRAIRGRMNDYFQLPGGRLVHPYEVTQVTREKTPWIREFQITQERMDRIVMRVVPFYQPSSRELAVVQNPATALLGPEARFEVELVSEIQLEPSGKFRVYRSMVSSAYDKLSLDHGGTRCGK